MKYRVTDIEWDTDGEDPEEIGLPLETTIEADCEEDVGDALADYHGWCVLSFVVVHEDS